MFVFLFSTTSGNISYGSVVLTLKLLLYKKGDSMCLNALYFVRSEKTCYS